MGPQPPAVWRVIVEGRDQLPFFQTMFIAAHWPEQAISEAIAFAVETGAANVHVDVDDVERCIVEESELSTPMPRTSKACGAVGVIAYSGRVFAV